MTDLENQVAEIIQDAVDRILRLVSGDIDVGTPRGQVDPHPDSPRLATPRAPRGSGDPILDNFLGVNR